MIRLIATDLDDTLLDPHSRVTERTLAALRGAIAAGCGVCLSSGRMLEAMLPLARLIGVNAPMLLYNGAMIHDPVAAETLWSRRIPYDTALAVVERAEAMGLYIQLYPGEGYFCERVTDYTRAYAASIRVEPTPVGMPMSRWLRARPADMQKLLIIDTPEGADRAQAALREAFPRGVVFLKSKPHYIEIAPEGVDKGQSLALLAWMLGLEREEVMAFGDGQNDVPMLAWAGEGWAMANSCPQALASVSRVAPSSAEDGVAQVIERCLAEGRFAPMRRQ